MFARGMRFVRLAFIAIVVLAGAIQVYRYVATGEVRDGPIPIKEAQAVLATIEELMRQNKLPEARDRCESLLAAVPQGATGPHDAHTRAEALLQLKNLQAQGVEVADRPEFARPIGPGDVAGGDAALGRLAARSLRVTGRGYPPPGAPGGPAGLLAERTAILDGYRALTEELRGVRINERLTVSDLIVQSQLNGSVYGTVRGARVVATRRLADGMVEVDIALDGAELARALRGDRAVSR